MDFTTPLTRANFRLREKRFFAHCTLEDGREITAHCANTGSLKGVLNRNITGVYLSFDGNPARKLQYSLELAELDNQTLVAVHTGRTNKLAAEYLTQAYPGHTLRAEATYDGDTEETTRFDFLLTAPTGQRTWVEVKTVTCTADNDNAAIFPDAVSTRGLKHLHTLAHAVQRGDNALQLYLILREDTPYFRAAEEIDPAYAAALRQAVEAGVQATAMQCTVTSHSIVVDKPLKIML